MARRKKTQKNIEQYKHDDKERLNNPPVGLVTPKTDPDANKNKKYEYDPHLDPQLQWAGKAEHTSFEVPTVSLHVHERIDPKTIIKSVKTKEGEVESGGGKKMVQQSLFDNEKKKPLREAIDFYKHTKNWSNRLIAGDSLLVMNSLLEKEGMAGKVQMMYFDPPYGIKYGSNFQPFTNKRDVKDGNDNDLTAEPEMVKAFRDTWELGIHSYLTYLRDRLLLARELLHESGSVFVQISDENVHRVRMIMDEVFGAENFVSLISYASTSGFETTGLSRIGDYIIWYAKVKEQTKIRSLWKEKVFGGEGSSAYKKIELSDGRRMSIAEWQKEIGEIFDYEKLPKGAKIFAIGDITSQDPPKEPQPFNFRGQTYEPKQGNHWKANYPDGMEKLKRENRIETTKNYIGYVRYFYDFPMMQQNNMWSDTLGQNQYGAEGKKYAVQTGLESIKRCLLMSTDPGDLVLDITCGSGTTAAVAEQWGRRWITCDTSRVATTLAKQRLMTANFDYYKLAHRSEGVGSGFQYKTVPHITLKSIANDEPPATETLYDQPFKDTKKSRVTGPFTVEAVPAPYSTSTKNFDDIEGENENQNLGEKADISIARSGETLRQDEWRDELLRTGVRAKGGKMLSFSRIEALSGTRFIQAEGETKPESEEDENFIPQKVLIVFGPEHAPLEQRQVENAWQEAKTFKPDILLFCAFHFDNEAAKDIDELSPEIAEMQLLKAQMNADLLTDDLQKKRRSNESFWLIGQPDVQVKKLDGGKFQVEVIGFDYYNPKTGNVDSGGSKDIATWMLDTDYDDRAIFPNQVFFPMSGAKDGWSRLAKNLKAEIDEEKIEAFRGTKSLPFSAGENKKIAVKIVDNRGIESLRVINL